MKRKTVNPPIPQPGEGKRGEQGHLGYLLRQASMALRQRMEQALTEFGVTQPQFMVLTMVGAYPGLSNADVARLAMLTPQTVNAIVALLKRAGQIVSAPHPVHGRIRQLTLTPVGKRTLGLCRTRVSALETAIAKGLSAAQERTIRQWLVSVAVGDEATKGRRA